MDDQRKNSADHEGCYNLPSNFRPITCLPLTWKWLTWMISEEIYGYLDERNLFPEEKKGCRKKSRGTQDLLFIEKMVLRHSRTNQRILAMAWIDYRKAFDMVPHSWLEECLNVWYGAKETRGIPNRYQRWNRISSASKESAAGISKDPPKSL